VKLLFLAPLGVLCACSSSDFHPYVGQRQKWPTSPGTFVDSQYEVPVYYGYPPRPYTVLGMMEETSHGRHSNAVDDAAQEARPAADMPTHFAFRLRQSGKQIGLYHYRRVSFR
jgi:hypothetical protein